jgi:hypothetical protein
LPSTPPFLDTQKLLSTLLPFLLVLHSNHCLGSGDTAALPRETETVFELLATKQQRL